MGATHTQTCTLLTLLVLCVQALRPTIKVYMHGRLDSRITLPLRRQQADCSAALQPAQSCPAASPQNDP